MWVSRADGKKNCTEQMIDSFLVFAPIDPISMHMRSTEYQTRAVVSNLIFGIYSRIYLKMCGSSVWWLPGLASVWDGLPLHFGYRYRRGVVNSPRRHRQNAPVVCAGWRADDPNKVAVVVFFSPPWLVSIIWKRN